MKESDSSNRSLFFDSKFWPLYWTQFLGAFNDNLFKNALVILITFEGVKLAGSQGFEFFGLKGGVLVAFCNGLFILPFFLFSASAGQIADKYSRTKLIVLVKLWEVAVMMIAAIGFYLGNTGLLVACVFFMGLQSTFFGPIKYSMIPEVVSTRDLVKGNALVEMGTFLAILLGTILGGVLIGLGPAGITFVSVLAIVIALVGVATSLKLVKLEPADSKIKLDPTLFRPTIKIIKMAAKTRSVILSILGISWFWLLGLAILTVLLPFSKNDLHGNEHLVTFFLAIFTVGIGVGAMVCEKFSFRQLEMGLVPFGSIGLSLFLFDLYWVGIPEFVGSFALGEVSPMVLLSHFEGFRIAFDLLMFSLFGGFFSVPLYTLVQERSEPSERSRVIAANNIVNAFFMVLGSLLLMGAYSAGAENQTIFLVLSLLNIGAAIYIYTLLPEFLYRFLCYILANIIYRLKVRGRRNIPQEGPAVLVCNHVSFVDWLILASATQRPVRFVMHYTFLEIPLTGKIFRDAKVIPIAGSREDPKILDEAFEKISDELRAGEIVCLFPEGGITFDGKLQKFRPGIERIIAKDAVPVIPMRLDGLWGSFFSRKDGKAFTKPFRRFWSRVSLRIGEPLSPNDLTADKLHEEVKALR